MLPELGHFALLLALALALAVAIVPLVGAWRGSVAWCDFARIGARIQLLFILIAYICLTAAFIGDDFSVAYVAQNANSQLPLRYKISAVWGGHAGSLLLWVLILSLWSCAVSVYARAIPPPMLARVLAVMAWISVGFLLFMVFTSNPFARLTLAPLEGRDLNPLLQDFGLAVHPPMLYLGYVGFTVVFAFAIAALLSGRLDAAWARWARPWTNLAWLFLTIGIALGSWWAYYELGWGGWWFWDPVENASFMPWLVGTALIHSLAATEKRNAFKGWSVLLAILVFSLSLLGTFLVRSGVLVSVHAFATDPARGVFILTFLAVVIGGSLILYAWRAPALASQVRFALVSRETALLINNIFLGVLGCVVLLGTLYPLAIDALGLGQLSVGAPYFNRLFTLIGLPLVLLIGIGGLTRWRTDRATRLGRAIVVVFCISLGIGGAAPLLYAHYAWTAAIGVAAGSMVMLLSGQVLAQRAAGGGWWPRLRATPAAVYGMVVAHFGMGVFVIGVTLTSVYSSERDVRMAVGESYELNDYRFTFQGVAPARGANYTSLRGQFAVTHNGDWVAQLAPEKRTYQVQQNPMTEAAIAPGFTRDLYVALGEPLEQPQVWAVRLYYKPFIRWIWLGALLMAAGGLLGAIDRRYRLRAAIS